MNKECVSIDRSNHDLQLSGNNLRGNSKLGNLLDTLGELEGLKKNGVITQAAEDQIKSLIRNERVNQCPGLSKPPLL